MRLGSSTNMVAVWGVQLDWSYYVLPRDFSQCVPECAPPVSTTSGVTFTPVPATASGTTNTARTEPQLQATGRPILALDGWAAGSYIQKASINDVAILGPAPTRAQFVTGESSSIRLTSWISGQCVSFPYLNVKSAETSYKPLAFEAVGTTLDWSFNGPNNTLNTPRGFNTFVACSDGALYLQTGTDLPSGNCTTTRLKTGPYY
ncbi:unnamed protein product [Rhizoctonia solani]|uniref:Uncharacterized protein n=1 Tax=Rhizoctonia solani TaxID=456999 RepID=A0A8H3B079_9AGAM|nr:unnamed protein product [Rhizoctonia solani]